VGENDTYVREQITNYLGYLGVDVDAEKNSQRWKAMDISKPSAKTRVLVVPTNEELVIARDTKTIVGGK
jgi:acetate kinase